MVAEAAQIVALADEAQRDDRSRARQRLEPAVVAMVRELLLGRLFQAPAPE